MFSMRTNLASIAYAQLRTASTHASLRGPSIQAIAPSLFVSRRFASVEKQDKAAGHAAVEESREIILEHAKNPGEEIKGAPSVQYSENEYNMPHPCGLLFSERSSQGSFTLLSLPWFLQKLTTLMLWAKEYIYRIKNTHLPTKGIVDKLAYWTINTMRFNFDWMSGYIFGQKSTRKALMRIVFLETVAGVPGSIAGILRHLASLRRMRRDHGWIHTLFEEAENERMHLLIYMTLKQPSPIFRSVVWITQGIFFNFFFLGYLVSPRFCHRLVGYLEEQAVYTYSSILTAIDNNEGDLGKWKTEPAPEIAINYWKLPANATVRDIIAVTRADEAHHRDVNHQFASMQPTDSNPFRPGF